MKKKIGIITILKVNNYGAELQAFALQRKLNNLGLSAEIIDYLYYKHPNFLYTSTAKPFVKLCWTNKVKEWMNPLLEQIKSLPYRSLQKIRERKFSEFHQKHTRIASETFRSIDALYKAKLDYDIYMVGSDQVWNPNTNISLKPYFLLFAPPGKRKVSYASSFGVSSVPAGARDIYKQCLNNLDRIAVREKEGVKLVEEITGRKAEHVLDPTLLLDQQDWQKVAAFPENTKPYVLLYVLTDSFYTTQLARKIAKDSNWDIVRICKNSSKQERDASIQNILDAGPSEFIGLFLKASFVVTNSFHGTAFAVNFAKPFYTVLPGTKSNNSRQEGLLHLLHLEKRLLREDTPFPEKKDYSVDFTEASHALANEKERSTRYLVSSVAGN